MAYVRRPMQQLGAADQPSAVRELVHSDVVTTGSAALLIYHGYRRTGSILWALVYGLAGKKVPVVAVPVALAQGLGKKKTCTTE